MKRGLLIALAAVICSFADRADAGEIVTKTWYNSKGEAVKSYVYDASRSLRHFASPRQVNRYRRQAWYGLSSPVGWGIRSWGYSRSGYIHRGGYHHHGSLYHRCQPLRSGVQISGSRVNVSIARPVTVFRRN